MNLPFQKTGNHTLLLASLGSLLLLGMGTMGWWSQSKSLPIPSKSTILATFAQLPLRFEANTGQTAKPVSFLSKGNGYVIYFTPEEIVFDYRSTPLKNNHNHKTADITSVTSNDVLRMQFIDANKQPTIVGQEELTGKSNYFIGNDPKKWHRNITNYAKVHYQNLYPGIDMVFYGNNSQLEYDIRVAKGANPSSARFQVKGAKGIKINQQGDLVITTPEDKEVRMLKPVIYQNIQGTKHSVDGGFVLADNKEISFKVGDYDKTQTLVIDPPVLAMSSFLGGSGGDNAALAVTILSAPLPAIYITGYTNSTDFPTVGPFQATNKGTGRTAFVTKYDRATNSLVYSTYLGGSGGNDEGFAIAVDSLSSAYVTGETNSKDFPTKNPFQATNSGAKDFAAFVTKINPEGNDLVYSTYLSGSGENQEGNGIAVDNQGFAYVVGETTSKDFPIKNAFQATNKGPKFTAYITKLNTVGNGLVFSTYLGGSGGQDEINGISIDQDKNIYVTGETNSKDFPTKNPIQPTPKPAGAAQTGFVTKMNASGTDLIYSTYLGGSGGNDYPTSIHVDSLDNVYVVGYTNSSDFPVLNPVQATNNGPNFTAFITKINALGSGLVYSTYLGGSGGNDRLLALEIDVENRPHFCGYTNSIDFPLKNALQTTNKGPDITAMGGSLNADGTLLNSSYLGGSGGNDRCFGVTMDELTNDYFVGLTNSADWPIINAVQPTKTSAIMAFFINVTLV